LTAAAYRSNQSTGQVEGPDCVILRLRDVDQVIRTNQDLAYPGERLRRVIDTTNACLAVESPVCGLDLAMQ
jgi:hypothetical protein